MRKFAIIGLTAIAFGGTALTAPTDAQARFGAATIAQATATPAAQPVQYYSGYSYYRPYYAPRYYGGGYYDYRQYGYPGSRNALDTCSYC